MIRTGILGTAFLLVAALASSGQDKPAASAQPKLASQHPMPKAGDRVRLTRSDFTVKDKDGELEVTEIETGDEEGAILATTNWTFDADGWFDSEGFNITKVYPRSGLWAMRPAKNHKPPVNPLTPAASTSAATPILNYRVGPDDVVTHIDGVAVTSFDRLVYAINGAANKRDVSIVVMDGTTGRKHLYYLTAVKSADR